MWQANSLPLSYIFNHFLFWNTVLLSCPGWPQTCHPIASDSQESRIGNIDLNIVSSLSVFHFFIAIIIIIILWDGRDMNWKDCLLDRSQLKVAQKYWKEDDTKRKEKKWWLTGQILVLWFLKFIYFGGKKRSFLRKFWNNEYQIRCREL